MLAIVKSLALLLRTSLKHSQSFHLIFSFISLRISFVRDVCSRVALMEVFVCQTGKSKPFHARVFHRGLETDVKLDWVTLMTWPFCFYKFYKALLG